MLGLPLAGPVVGDMRVFSTIFQVTANIFS